MAPIRRLAVIANLTRPRAQEGLVAFAKAAREAGVDFAVDPRSAKALPQARVCAVEEFTAFGAQAVASLGGDGSLLAAAHALARAGIDLPLIGLNVGHLGYLTAVDEEGFGAMLAALAAGRFAEERRTALAARVRRADGTEAALPNALNDVVLSRAEGGHAFALELALDGHPVARWLCDGLILATPTGSTAYSLSVGGPVMAPDARALVVSVIAPHTLSARPLVVPDAVRVFVRVSEDGGTPATAYADGQAALPLSPGDALCVQAAAEPIRLLAPLGRNPYAPLSRKLGWGLSPTR